MKPKEKNVKKNDKGEYLFWSYTYRNVHTGLYYVGVTVNPSNRKSLWKNLKYKYAGDKVYKARKQYHDWANDWEYTQTELTALTYDSLLTSMEQTEAYLIAFHDSFAHGYNTRPSGGGRGSRSRILVVFTKPEDKNKQVLFNSCEDVAVEYTMSTGNVYHYAYRTTTHKKRNGMAFIPIDDPTITSTLAPEFITKHNIILP